MSVRFSDVSVRFAIHGTTSVTHQRFAVCAPGRRAARWGRARTAAHPNPWNRGSPEPQHLAHPHPRCTLVRLSARNIALFSSMI